MTYKFPVVAGGASMFTALTDVPSVYDPNSFFVVGAGGLTYGKNQTIQDIQSISNPDARSQSVLVAFSADYVQEADVSTYAAAPGSGDSSAVLQLTAITGLSDGGFQIQLNGPAAGSPQVTFYKSTTTSFSMTNFDVVGTQTVDPTATNFPGSAAGSGANSKWIKVRLGADEYAIQAIKITP